MQWIKKNMLLMGVLIVIIVGGVWYGMSGGGVESTQLLTTDVVNDSGSPTTDTVDRDLVETLLTLRAITLSGTIFNDPAFKALQDFGTTIVPEPVGRDNPFAPINGAQPQPQSQTQAAGAAQGAARGATQGTQQGAQHGAQQGNPRGQGTLRVGPGTGR